MTCIDVARSLEMMQAKTMPAATAIKIASELFDVPQKAIVGPRKTQTVVWARFLAMWAAHSTGSTTYAGIGRAFGDRDHTTVIHAVERAESLQEQNPVLKAIGNEILRRMGEAA